MRVLQPKDAHSAHEAVGAELSEPIVVLRGADTFAPHMLLDYAARCEATGRATEAAAARQEAERLFAYQRAHGSVAPGAAPPKAK